MEKMILERARWLYYSKTCSSKEESIRQAYDELGDDHILSMFDIEKDTYLKTLIAQI